MAASSKGPEGSGEIENTSQISADLELIARLCDEETRCRAQGFIATADALQDLIADMVRDLKT